MKKGIAANCKSEDNHCPLKKYVMDNVNTKQGQTAHHQWQHSAMNSAGYRSGNTDYIPIVFCFHCKNGKYSKFAITLQVLKSEISINNNFLPATLNVALQNEVLQKRTVILNFKDDEKEMALVSWFFCDLVWSVLHFCFFNDGYISVKPPGNQ